MTITELYEDLKTNLPFNEIKGEIELTHNEIIWIFSLEMVDSVSDSFHGGYDYCFDIIPSTEELLNNAYSIDYDIIQEIIDDIDDIRNWNFSTPEIINDKIIYKIVKN